MAVGLMIASRRAVDSDSCESENHVSAESILTKATRDEGTLNLMKSCAGEDVKHARKGEVKYDAE